MTYLVIAGVLLLSVNLYLIIELKKSIHLLYVIPLSIFFIVGTYFYIDSILGYATEKKEEKQFVLLSYFIPPAEDGIYLWIILKGEEEPKGIIIPYSREDHEKLDGARKKMADGMAMSGLMATEEKQTNGSGQEDGKGKEGNGLGTEKSSEGMLNLFELTPDYFLPPKDVPPENPTIPAS